jgi:hypothetical protein
MQGAMQELRLYTCGGCRGITEANIFFQTDRFRNKRILSTT